LQLLRNTRNAHDESWRKRNRCGDRTTPRQRARSRFTQKKSASIERNGERVLDAYSAALARQGSRQRAHPTPGPHTTVKWTPLSRGGNYTSKTVLRQCCKMPALANFRGNDRSIAMKPFSFPHRAFLLEQLLKKKRAFGTK